MKWSIRHQGSPRTVDGLTAQQVVEGLQDGQWEPTDEIRGEGESAWIGVESHPQFEEVTADLEPPLVKHYDDETRLDMNPLIDVCLVLLIFFILTTSYAALQKVLDMGRMARDKPDDVPTVTKQHVEDVMVVVTASMQNGKPVIQVEGRTVDPDDLVSALHGYTNKEKRKTELVVDAGPGVTWDTVVRIQDAAKGAGMDHVHFLEKATPTKASK
jgi:biopolymer transport protein ExbD